MPQLKIPYTPVVEFKKAIPTLACTDQSTIRKAISDAHKTVLDL